MARDRSGRTEGSLLFLAVVLVASALVLVFLGRTLSSGLGFGSTVDVNSASAEQLAVTLRIDPALGALLAATRQRVGAFDHVDALAEAPVFPDRRVADAVWQALRRNRIDPDTATATDLARSAGIDRPVARRMVRYRDSLPGERFRRPQDILQVPVVSADELGAARGHLVVRGPGTVFAHFTLVAVLLVLAMVAFPGWLRRSGTGGDPYLLPCALLLGGLGVVAMFSVKDPLRDAPAYQHQALGLGLGLLGMAAAARLPARTRRGLRRYTYVWALASMLLLGALWLFGRGPEGVHLTFLGFQPIEVIKILLVLFVAGYLGERADLVADALHRWRPPLPRDWLARGLPVPRREDLLPLLGMYALALLLFLAVRDLGPALVLFGALLATLYLATGRSGVTIVGVLLAAVGGLAAYRLHAGVVPVRVEMWLSPWSNPHRLGMQLGQGLWGMASGGLWGSGLGLGAPGTVPRAGSDLVFASLAEELGVVGSLALLTLYTVLTWRGLVTARRASSDFDRILATGLTALLACQTFFIVAGVTGLLPLTGITLPFVSWGNSSLVADFVLLGLLRGISIRAPGEPAPEPRPLFAHTTRRFAVAACLALLGLVGVGRILVVQGLAADDLAGRTIRTPDADGIVRDKVNPRLRAVEQQITRGTIYDRRGRVLATSRLDQISRALESDPEAARRYYAAGRYYPYGRVCAHLVGYLDPGLGGPTALEKDFDADLRGFRSYSELLPDYRAKDLPRWLPGWLTGRTQRTSRDLALTVDAELQESAARLLRDTMRGIADRRTGKPKDRGALVMLDPSTGETLASVALPSFDPNRLTRASMQAMRATEGDAARLLDRSRFGYYPPGSTIKVATAAAGLESGLDPAYRCRHVAHDLRWTFGGRTYARARLQDDAGDPPHGVVHMGAAVRVSCNLYFANLGIVLGPRRLRDAFAGDFEMSHVAPLERFAEDLPDNAFGQGTLLASPTEMARVAAAVAHEGRMMETALVREVREPGGKVVRAFQPSQAGRPIGELNARRLADMMRSVVTGGTARGLFDDLPAEVAGKTGTAQTLSGDGMPHSWFIGFTPFSRPQYAFACIIENGGYGRRGAAEAVHKVLREVFRP